VDKSAQSGLEEAAEHGLAVVSAVGHILDTVQDDYAAAIDSVVEACVPTFADLCAIEVAGAEAEPATTAARTLAGSGLHLPEGWVDDLIRGVAGLSQPALAFDDAGETLLGALRAHLGARSLLVAPIFAGGATLGWLVAGTGASRYRFGRSDLQVGEELGGRLGATIQRVALYRELQASARQHSRVAHDLNNLLTLILGYSDLLGRGIADPQLGLLAGEIGGAARRAAGLTQEMLDSSGQGRIGPEVGGDMTAVSNRLDAEPADGDGWPPERSIAGRILYVEDEPALRRAGLETLATAGLDVVAAESAETALSILAAEPAFDALVTDIALPGLTGVQLVRAVHLTHPDLRVLYVTGYAGAPDPDHTPAPGEAVLRKPYRPNLLRLRVAELLQQPETRGSAPVHGS
jgi:CheY-like chemotaxis protein